MYGGQQEACHEPKYSFNGAQSVNTSSIQEHFADAIYQSTPITVGRPWEKRHPQGAYLGSIDLSRLLVNTLQRALEQARPAVCRESTKPGN
jgi:hypothetical protein